MKKVALIFFLLLLASRALATNYYFKDDGNDSANGLSDANAKRSLSQVAFLPLTPGDKVLLKCDDTWTEEQMIVAASGTSANHITIGAYYVSGAEVEGISGSKPVIDGNDNYPYSSLDCSHYGEALIEIAGAYVDVENLTVTQSTGRGIDVADNDYVTIENCTVSNIFNQGIHFYNSDHSSAISNTVYQTSERRDFGCSDAPAALQFNRSDYGTAQYNYVYDNWQEGIGFYFGSDYGTVEYNEAFDNRNVDIYVGRSGGDTGQYFIVRYNLVYSTPTPFPGDTSMGIGVTHEDGTFYSNDYIRVYGNLIAAKDIGMWFTVQVEDTAEHIEVFNNTFVVPDGAITVLRNGAATLDNGDPMYSDCSFVNNIMYVPSGTGTEWQNSTNGWIFSHNAWAVDSSGEVWEGNGDVITDSNFAKTTGWDALTDGSPLISDFAVTSGSTAINSGDAGVPVAFLLDEDGTEIISSPSLHDQSIEGIGYEIGALVYEEGGAPTPTDTGRSRLIPYKLY
jgi:parallel beta-helix repeat protein